MEHAPLRNGGGGDDDNNTSAPAYFVCNNCQEPAAAGSKLQLCGRCRNCHLCSEACQKEAWPEHKLVCDSLRAARENSSGSGSRHGKESKNYFLNLFVVVPCLIEKVQFLAWKHRDETPVIRIEVSSVSEIVVQMIPRSQWEDRHDVVTTANVFLSSGTSMLTTVTFFASPTLRKNTLNAP